jgi:hypothetical protein
MPHATDQRDTSTRSAVRSSPVLTADHMGRSIKRQQNGHSHRAAHLPPAWRSSDKLQGTESQNGACGFTMGFAVLASPSPPAAEAPHPGDRKGEHRG